MQLELLLRELLGEETSDLSGALSSENVPPEVVELRETARRLREAAQRIPLPEGRKALRRALVTTALRHRRDWSPSGYPRQRPRRRLAIWAAAVLILGVLGLQAGLMRDAASPSSPWYGMRVALEELEVALVPSPLEKAAILVKETQTRLTEIQTMANLGDFRGLRRAADALDGEAGWLHAVMTTLSAADQERLRTALEHM
jgi:hypothetical protein